MLKVVPILDGLSRDELKEFERIVHHRHYKADENIFLGRRTRRRDIHYPGGSGEDL